MGVSDLAKEIWVSPAAVGGFFRGHEAESPPPVVYMYIKSSMRAPFVGKNRTKLEALISPKPSLVLAESK